MDCANKKKSPSGGNESSPGEIAECSEIAMKKDIFYYFNKINKSLSFGT